MQYTIKCRPRVPWNVFDRACLFGLEVSDFFYRNMHAAIFNAIHILQHAICVQYAYCNALQYEYCASQYAYCDRIHIASNTYTPTECH